MALALAIGIPVSALAADAVTGFVAGIGAGGIVALRSDVERPWRARDARRAGRHGLGVPHRPRRAGGRRPAGADPAVHERRAGRPPGGAQAGATRSTAPSHGPRLRSPSTRLAVACRSVPIAIVPGPTGTATRPSERLTATIVECPASPAPRAGRRGQRRVGARTQVRRLATQGDQVAAQAQDRARVPALVLDVVRTGVPDREPRPNAFAGEPGPRPGVPLHRRSAGVASGLSAELTCRVAHVVAGDRYLDHPDLVAEVQERRPAERQQHQERAPSGVGTVGAPPRREPPDVVVRAGPRRLGERLERVLGRLHDPAQGLGVQVGEDEREVEAQVELVAGLTVEAGDLPEVEDPGLADQDPRRIGRVGDPSPVAVDLVHLGAVHVVDLALAAAADVLGIVVRRSGVVAQLAVLDEAVRHVDAEPGDPAVEPEPEDLLELAAHVLVPPVQIRLLHQEVVQVVLAGPLVELPRPPAEDREPVVGRRAVGPWVAPHVPPPVLGVAGTTGRRRTTGGRRWCGSARGRGSPGCLATPRPRPGDRGSPGRRAPDGRRGSPRRRTPSPGPATG